MSLSFNVRKKLASVVVKVSVKRNYGSFKILNPDQKVNKVKVKTLNGKNKNVVESVTLSSSTPCVGLKGNVNRVSERSVVQLVETNRSYIYNKVTKSFRTCDHKDARLYERFKDKTLDLAKRKEAEKKVCKKYNVKALRHALEQRLDRTHTFHMWFPRNGTFFVKVMYGDFEPSPPITTENVLYTNYIRVKKETDRLAAELKSLRETVEKEKVVKSQMSIPSSFAEMVQDLPGISLSPRDYSYFANFLIEKYEKSSAQYIDRSTRRYMPMEDRQPNALQWFPKGGPSHRVQIARFKSKYASLLNFDPLYVKYPKDTLKDIAPDVGVDYCLAGGDNISPIPITSQ